MSEKIVQLNEEVIKGQIRELVRGKSSAQPILFDYSIPRRGGARRGFCVVHRVEKQAAENTAKPRRNCSGEALPLTT